MALISRMFHVVSGADFYEKVIRIGPRVRLAALVLSELVILHELVYFQVSQFVVTQELHQQHLQAKHKNPACDVVSCSEQITHRNFNFVPGNGAENLHLACVRDVQNEEIDTAGRSSRLVNGVKGQTQKVKGGLGVGVHGQRPHLAGGVDKSQLGVSVIEFHLTIKKDSKNKIKFYTDLRVIL
jgi:hypothetical protein